MPAGQLEEEWNGGGIMEQGKESAYNVLITGGEENLMKGSRGKNIFWGGVGGKNITDVYKTELYE